MKSIIFTVRPDEKTSIITVINGLKSYSGRCRVDFAANKIDIDIEEDEKIDEIIDFINQYYTILRIDISKSQNCKETEEAGENIVTFLPDEEFVINNEHYTSSEVKLALDKLLKVVNLAFASKKRISSEEIALYLETCKQDMAMKFNPLPRVKIPSVGDIVTVNYGMHLEGELNCWIGGVVCDVKDKMICVIPVMKDDESDYKFETQNCTFFNKFVVHGSIKFNMTSYVRFERVISINGKVSDNYMQELKEKLAETFCFANN